MSVQKHDSYRVDSVVLRSNLIESQYYVRFEPYGDGVRVWYSGSYTGQFMVPAQDIRDLASALLDLADYIDGDEVPF